MRRAGMPSPSCNDKPPRLPADSSVTATNEPAADRQTCVGQWNDDDFDVLADSAVAHSAACLQTAVLTKWWRQEFGGLKTEQVKRLKDLELENSRLRKAVSDLTLDKLILQEAARGNF